MQIILMEGTRAAMRLGTDVWSLGLVPALGIQATAIHSAPSNRQCDGRRRKLLVTIFLLLQRQPTPTPTSRTPTCYGSWRARATASSSALRETPSCTSWGFR